MKKALSIKQLVASAKTFCKNESKFQNKDLFGVTDGKAVGTYIEHKFQAFLEENFNYEKGSSARGIDLPSKKINTDIKVTSIRQPQSSCPFRDAKQKIFGLGYNLLLFVYNKTDDAKTKTTQLDFVSCAFIDKERTADYTTTFRLRQMLEDGANEEDVIGYLSDRYISNDLTMLQLLAKRILITPPIQGYLFFSNAFKKYKQYENFIETLKQNEGFLKIISSALNKNLTS